MVRRFLLSTTLFAIGFACCTAKVYASHRHSLTELKRELTLAHKDLALAQSRVMRLEEAIAQIEIQQIQDQINNMEKGELAALLHSREQRLAFFSDQRETLSTIIRNHPICATQAQAVLDEILTLITHISDEMID